LEVDFFWSDHGVVAEADSWEHHRTRWAFERDRARDELLSANGFHPMRFTWRRLRDDPSGVADSIRRVLANARRFLVG
jgi:very-short-patch-repair endonuclease